LRSRKGGKPARNTGPPVFIAQSLIENLAVSPSGAVFYTTAKGTGYLKAPGQNRLFLPQKVVSLDSRADRLILLTDERDIVMFEPVSGFD
jgi:hypothetical protein